MTSLNYSALRLDLRLCLVYRKQVVQGRQCPRDSHRPGDYHLRTCRTCQTCRFHGFAVEADRNLVHGQFEFDRSMQASLKVQRRDRAVAGLS